jgi:histidinol-phosphatase (PHP family)
MLVDYHMHVKFDTTGKKEPIEYVKVAKTKGLDEIGFSDHFNFFPNDYSMNEEELSDYAKMIKELKNKVKMPLRFGIEMDYIPDFEKRIKSILKLYRFDYVIGSIHLIDGWLFDDQKKISGYNRWNKYALYQRYFELLRKAAESKMFNIMGHADIIKIFNFKPRKDIGDIMEETAVAFMKSKVCVEINTKGLEKPCKEMYPSEKFLKICFEHGIPITLGSDAHCPRNVGRNFDKAVTLAKRIGYDKIATFENRKMKLMDLD